MNLLANAAQAVGDGGGQVRISTTRLDDDVIISITDTGRGIAPENLNRIFEPFFTTKSVGEGTGLGLSITFGIVEKHGGTIDVKSKLNEGTTFTVKLPIHIRLPLDNSE
jgi:signal transduction histidine kinase